MPVPFHKSEQNFRRYEGIIREMVARYPTPIYVKPEGFSIETVINRLRDATKWYLPSDWTSDIDKTLLKTVLNEYVFTHDGVRVRAGRKEKPATSDVAHVEHGGATSVDQPSLDELKAFGLLLANGRLHTQLQFTNVSPDVASAFVLHTSDDPRIQFWQEGSTWIML